MESLACVSLSVPTLSYGLGNGLKGRLRFGCAPLKNFDQAIGSREAISAIPGRSRSREDPLHAVLWRLPGHFEQIIF